MSRPSRTIAGRWWLRRVLMETPRNRESSARVVHSRLRQTASIAARRRPLRGRRPRPAINARTSAGNSSLGAERTGGGGEDFGPAGGASQGGGDGGDSASAGGRLRDGGGDPGSAGGRLRDGGEDSGSAGGRLRDCGGAADSAPAGGSSDGAGAGAGFDSAATSFAGGEGAGLRTGGGASAAPESSGGSGLMSRLPRCSPMSSMFSPTGAQLRPARAIPSPSRRRPAPNTARFRPIRRAFPRLRASAAPFRSASVPILARLRPTRAAVRAVRVQPRPAISIPSEIGPCFRRIHRHARFSRSPSRANQPGPEAPLGIRPLPVMPPAATDHATPPRSTRIAQCARSGGVFGAIRSRNLRDPAGFRRDPIAQTARSSAIPSPSAGSRALTGHAAALPG